jgi:hypothetical protein
MVMKIKAHRMAVFLQLIAHRKREYPRNGVAAFPKHSLPMMGLRTPRPGLSAMMKQTNFRNQETYHETNETSEAEFAG